MCSTVLLSCLIGTQSVYADKQPLHTVERVELDKYLGVWYEIARKPMYFQNQCARDVTARYTVNENGNIAVDNRCYNENGVLQQALGEAFVINPPFNSKLKVGFLPEAIRWVPIVRGDYWILKLDENYQMALVGEPSRKYLWLLSREQHPDTELVNEYLNYAKSIGYNLKDIIRTEQTEP
ncbi:lipocalin family protein [Acinetobacter sp. ANC 4648]|uniref:lipocalin family protein n=1 Tax=Acinetobacter sp. ANC 4648 TaxID=1977875 RepID=UPI001D17BCAD|nr:lipocalin family protein [Acinetobacter sp. ANC 4648]